MTGVEGAYDPVVHKYQPPALYDTWEEVVKDKRLQLIVENNIRLY